MQLVGDVAPLLFLHRDQLAIEAAILLAGDMSAPASVLKRLVVTASSFTFGVGRRVA